MNCPKCGQDVVTINGKDVCTNCGILSENPPLNVQIANGIKAKIPQAEPPEEYVSPTEQGFQPGTSAPTPQETGKAQSQKPPVPSSLEKSIQELTEAEPASSAPAQKSSLPDFPSQETGTILPEDNELVSQHSEPVEGVTGTGNVEVISKIEAKIEEDQRPVAKVSESEKVIASRPEFNQEVQGLADQKKNILISAQQVQGDSSKLKIEPFQSGFPIGGEGTKAMYPSHQVSPKIFKTLIIIVLVIVAIAACFYAYLHFDGIKQTINQMIVLSGELIFQ